MHFLKGISFQNHWNTLTGHSHFLWFLFGYHTLFILFAYLFRVARGISDAHFYWGYSENLLDKPWWDYANFGTDFMLFVTYPFVYLGLPFWFGFLLLGTLGFFGIRNWIFWLQLEVGTPLQFKGWNVLPFFYFWPNLHFWTASLGKEALIFWALATIFLKVSQQQFRTFVFGLAVFVLLLLRPHVALFLLLAFLVVQLFRSDLSLSKRLKGLAVAMPVCVLLVVVVLQLSRIRRLDWPRIQRFNDYSVLSFEGSGSYVPMLDYSFFYKVVSLHFRPFIWEFSSLFSFFAAVDNLVLLAIHVLFFYMVWRYFRLISLSATLRLALVFALVCSCIYVFRYANFGIFMRTKIMWVPFELGVFGVLFKFFKSLRV